MNKQYGFGMIAAIAVLVILASLGAALVNMGAAQHTSSVQDVQAARAWQAAKAGNEWGLYQALKGGWTTCGNETQNLDLTTDVGFRVTVTCTSSVFNEGETSTGTRSVRVFQIIATACNSPTTCPDNTLATSRNYVERVREVIATDNYSQSAPLCACRDCLFVNESIRGRFREARSGQPSLLVGTKLIDIKNLLP